MKKFGAIRKKLLITCLSASIALHIGAIWYFYAHPFGYIESEDLALMKSSAQPQMMPKDDESIYAERFEKALEDSLNTVVAISKSELHHDIATSKNASETHTIETMKAPAKKKSFNPQALRDDELIMMETPESAFSATMPPPFDPELEAALSEFALDDELDDPFATYESEKYASIDFSDHRQFVEPTTTEVVDDDYSMTESQFSPSALPMHRSAKLSPHFVASLKKLKTQAKHSPEELSEEHMFTELAESTTPSLVLPNSVDYLRNQWIKRSLAERSLPDLEHYGLDEIASTIEWEENVDIHVAMMPDPESNKYIFSLTIQPDFEAECQDMAQNFYFLIDRSSSVEKTKFNRYKRAVQRSMAALRDGDHFNIYIFDKKITKLSDHNLPVTAKTIQMAEGFLENQPSKTHFAAGDVYTSLETMLPDHFDPNEMHSIILITDGNTLLKSGQQKRTLSTWAQKYDGNVNFYPAACGVGNNLVLLDLLSYTTGGKLCYSDTNAGFPRKLVSLVRDLHHPVIKNLSLDISPLDSTAQVTAFPRSQILPPMYGTQPYVITGTVDELCDLTLFIQGRNNDRWLNIRKRVSLNNATKGGRSLEKLWAQTQSKVCYDHFLKNGKSIHLKEAKEIVAPYRGVISMD